MKRFHLDTDFLIRALSESGWERRRLLELNRSRKEIEISAVAWYEFCRGPRTPQQIATARGYFTLDGVVPFSERVASATAEVFRMLGSPRRRASDIAIGVTATLRDATLISCNARDFAGIPDLQVEDETGQVPAERH